MKDKFPRYSKIATGLCETERVFLAMDKPSRELLEKYLIKRGATTGAQKLRDIRRYIIQLYDFVEKPLDRLTKEDLDLLALTLKRENRASNDLRKTIRSFVLWHYKLLEMVENLKSVTTEEKITEDSLVDEKEVERMLKFAQTYKDKALLFVEFESGCRPQEILNLRWQDVKFADGRADINVYSGKTRKSRTFPLNKASRFLHDWKENYLYEDLKPVDYVFPSRSSRDVPMTTDGANRILRRMAGKAGIKKKIWNYIFRHTRATQLYEELPTPVVEKLMGHKDQYGRYAHISTRKAREEMLKKIYKIEGLPSGNESTLRKELEEVRAKLEQLQPANEFVRKLLKAHPELLEQLGLKK